MKLKRIISIALLAMILSICFIWPVSAGQDTYLEPKSGSGYTMDDTYLKGIQPNNNTASAIKSRMEFANVNEVKIFKSNGTTEIGNSEKVATGYLIKLYIGGSPVQGKTRTIVVKGDTNGDGKSNAMDATKILRHSARISSLSGSYLKAADLNNDGKVNSMDATKVLRYSANIINNY